MLSMFAVFAVTLGVFLLVIVGMAVGVIVGRREISGSCGGLGSQSGAEGGEASCSLCSNPDATCRELRNRMESVSGPNCSEAESCADDGCQEASTQCLGQDS